MNIDLVELTIKDGGKKWKKLKLYLMAKVLK